MGGLNVSITLSWQRATSHASKAGLFGSIGSWLFHDPQSRINGINASSTSRSSVSSSSINGLKSSDPQ